MTQTEAVGVCAWLKKPDLFRIRSCYRGLTNEYMSLCCIHNSVTPQKKRCQLQPCGNISMHSLIKVYLSVLVKSTVAFVCEL